MGGNEDYTMIEDQSVGMGGTNRDHDGDQSVCFMKITC